jgi:GT2 family glycosyltransferase
MSERPLVSIVILNYKRFDELQETIQRSKDITYQNIEIIIVDNGSNDRSTEYIKSLSDNEYVKILLSHNGGTAFGRTQGQKAAKGELIIHLDDDAYLNPYVVEKTVAIFNKNPKLAAIGYGLVNPLTIVMTDEEYWSNQAIDLKKGKFDNSYHFPISPSGAAFRRSALVEVGYFDLNWNWTTRTEDNELTLKLIAHGYNTVILDDLIAYHKAAPSHRVSEILTINSIHGILWVILKFYPPLYIIKKVFYLLFLCVYFTIMNKNTTYLKAIIRSMKKAFLMLENNVRITKKMAKRIDLKEINLFSMGDDVQWGGS